MRYLITILIVLMVFSFVGNYPVLSLIYPKHLTDYYTFLDFYAMRNVVYSVMFLCFFLIIGDVTTGFNSAVSRFGFMIAFGSFFDQLFLGINWYLRSDILLVMIAFEITIFQYLFYDRKTGRRV